MSRAIGVVAQYIDQEDKAEIVEADLELERKPVGALQTVKHIYKEEGAKGFWGGVVLHAFSIARH